MKRDQLVDCLKGYACLLVVFGHVIMGVRNTGNLEIPLIFKYIEDFIWTFHVPLFMFLSGYVYSMLGGWTYKGSRVKFLKNKFLNLGIPYFVFSASYIIMNSLVSSANTQNTLWDIVWLWKIPVAQYWFLFALFFLFVIWTILSGSMKNFQILIFMILLKYILPFYDFSFGSFEIVLGSCFAFGLGTSITKINIERYTNIKKIACIFIHIIIVSFFILTNISGEIIVDEFEVVLGVLSSISLISILIKFSNFKNFLLFINKYSFPIYLLHTIFTAGIRILLFKIGIENYFIHIFIGLLLGIVLPFFIAYLSNKHPLLNFFFYPDKNIKLLEKRS